METRSAERDLIEALRKYPPDFSRAKALLELGLDINAPDPEDAENSLLSAVFDFYPDYPEACETCHGGDCAGCPTRLQENDGRFIPKIVQFFLDNGFDVHREGGRAGAMALESLKLTTCNRPVLEACKLLLAAGADPSAPAYTDDNEKVVDSYGWEGFFYDTEGNHPFANLFEAIYQAMQAKLKGEDFLGIEYYTVCIGRRLEGVTLYSERDRPRGIFPDRPLFPRHKHCYRDTIVFHCGGIPLCAPQYASIYVDPRVPELSVSSQDLVPYFKDCIGQVITAITFGHRELREGMTRYHQPIINIQFGNGKTVRISINHGEVPKEEMCGWFEVL